MDESDHLRLSLQKYKPGSTLTSDERASISKIPERLVISVLGNIGHGKSSFIETCEYVGKDKKIAPSAIISPKDNHGGEETFTKATSGNELIAAQVGIIGKIYFQDTEGLAVVDKGAIRKINYDFDPSYFRQAVQKLKELVKQEHKPDDLNLIVIFWRANVPIPKDSDRADELQNLITTVKDITKVDRPYVVVTHKDMVSEVELIAVESMVLSLGGKAMSIANYTQKTKKSNPETQETALTLLSLFSDQADKSMLARAKAGSRGRPKPPHAAEVSEDIDHVAKGKVWLKEKNYEDAALSFIRGATTFANWEMWFQSSKALRKVGQFHLAYECSLRVVALEPARYHGYYAGGLCCLAFQDFHDGYALLERSLGLCPDPHKKERIKSKLSSISLPVFGDYLLKRTRGLRILCLDGGGIRGMVLVKIMEEIEKRTNQKVFDMFDLICGTSTGGLLAMAAGIKKMSPSTCMNLYETLGSAVFSNPNKLCVPAMFDHAELVRLLKKNLGDDRLCDGPAQPKIFAVASLAEGKFLSPFLFRNYDSKYSLYRGTSQAKLSDAGRATSAAPVFFEPLIYEYMHLMDGGLVANNPSFLALQEAKRIWGDQRIECLVSLGTGKPRSANMTTSPWQAQPLIELMPAEYQVHAQQIVDSVQGYVELGQMVVKLVTNSEIVHQQMETISSKERIFYQRVNPPIDMIELHETNPDKLNLMRQQTVNYLQKNTEGLEYLANFLKR